MAMGGFDREEFSAPLAEINTTPLVDVMLVLMVIFLVTAPMLTQAVKLELPADAAAAIRDEKPLTLSVDANGQYYWEQEPVSPQMLEQRLLSAARADARQPIHLRADTNVGYGKVSHVLAAAQRLGLTNIGLVTQPSSAVPAAR